MIASSIVASRIDYCNAVLVGTSSYNIQRLQRVQNQAARIVTGSRGRASATPLLNSLHWLPVEQRISFKAALITFKTIACGQPWYLHSLLKPYSAPRSLRSSTQKLLQVLVAKTSLHSRAFSVFAPRLWNRLPQALRDLSVVCTSSVGPGLNAFEQFPNLLAFKKLLKTVLFQSDHSFLVL